MMYHNSSFENKRENVMTLEQLDQVVEAILAGKYSWACLLILRSVGYNPMHYIPYRTYNRLIKENLQAGHAKTPPTTRQKPGDSTTHSTSRKLSEAIQDLPYLESVDRTKVRIKGGCSALESYIFSLTPHHFELDRSPDPFSETAP